MTEPQTQPRRPPLRSLIGVVVLLALGAGLYPTLLAKRDAQDDRLSTLRSGETHARRRVAEELGTGSQDQDEASTILQGLMAALDDADAGVRARAAHSLGRNLVLHPNTTERGTARMALAKLLDDPDRSVRGSSAISLSLVGDRSDAITAGLVDALRAGDPIIRDQAHASLASLGIPDDGHLRTILSLLQDDQAGVRDAAARLLAQAKPGPDPRERTRILIDALAAEPSQARRVAATVLGNVGQRRPEAAAALIGKLGDEDSSVRAAAAAALATFVDADVDDNDSDSDSDSEHQRRPVRVREWLEQAVSQDAAVEVRVAAAASLCASRRPPRAESLAKLAEALRQAGEHTDLIAVIKLETADPVPALNAALGDEDPRVREAVATALGSIAPGTDSAPLAISALTGLLRDRELAVSLAALEALVRFGKAARPAIPELSEMSRHPDRRLSAFATAVLKRVDPPVSRGD